MKTNLILLLSLLSFSVFGQGDAPPFLKGQRQSTKSVATTIIAPANQTTKISSSTALLETGNNNLLVNGEFEHALATTGWTSASTGTALIAFSSTNGLGTPKGAFLSCFGAASGGTCTVRQDVATTEIGQVVVSSMINSTDITGGIKVYARSNGANTAFVATSKEKQGNGFSPYSIPIMSDGTTTGIMVEITVAAGETIFLSMDRMSVGYKDVLASAGMIGPWTNGTCTSSWTANTTTTCKYRQNAQNLEIQYYWLLSGAPTSASLRLNLPSGFTIDTANIAAGSALNFLSGDKCSLNDTGTQFFGCSVLYSSSTSVLITTGNASGTYLTVGSDVTQAVPFVWAATDYGSVTVSVPVTQFAASANTYSTNVVDADRISEVIFIAQTTAPNGFIPANNKSIGNSGATYNGDTYRNLYDILWGMAGTVTTAGHPFRISSAKGASAAADWAANKTITIDFETNAPYIRAKSASAVLGGYTESENKAHTHILNMDSDGSPSGVGNNGQPPISDNVTAATSSTAIASSGGAESHPNEVAYNAYIRYAPMNISVVANLSGLEKCEDTYECTDTYTADVSAAGVVSNENVEWITGNASYGSFIYTFTWKTGLFATTPPNCQAFAVSAGTGDTKRFTSLSTTGGTLYTTVDGGTSGSTTAFTLRCSKGGADFTGKTAKAVASDQNVRVPGVLKAINFGALISGAGAANCTSTPCVVSNNKGGIVTAATRSAAGSYTLTFSGLASTPVCGFTLVNYSGTAITGCYRNTISSTGATYFCSLAAGGGNDSQFEISCTGDTP